MYVSCAKERQQSIEGNDTYSSTIFYYILEEKKLEDTSQSQYEINLHKFAVCTVRLRYNEITKAIKKTE